MSQAGTEIRHYLKGIENTLQSRNATEHSYRSNLKGLLETLFPAVTATNEPKRITCGAPDYIITNKQIPLGYIETKDIGIPLDQVERTDQMKRYLGSLANLILTDYVEFRWYISGQLRMTTRLAKVGANHTLLLETDGADHLADLLQGFMLTQVPTVSNPKELATRMAAIAQLIRNAISRAFESEEGGGSLHAQMESFRQVLLPDLISEQFADMYAQTICYGLFAARCNTESGTHFTREHASYDIPKTNPFLRKMFGYIAGPDLDERIVWAVDDLAEVLNRSDMEAILQDFGKHTHQEDPVVHFYETFLAEYDPKMREARGVYYTPEPVVSYIVSSVDHLLKQDFGLADGLADTTKLKATSSDGKYSLETHRVQILDPATGTGTFLYSVIDHIHESFRGNEGMWSSYVSQHLLPRLFGFELLMAPYAVAHMKLGLQLAETGYDFKSNERLGIYLTNTLEEGFEGGKLPFAEWLVEEATAASNAKYDAPIMVVLGNPPYSNFGMMNKSEWILGLLKDYKRDLQEKKLNLGNDYIKFIRFAQWRIEQTGYGILAFITSNSYIDGITHRQMRLSLMRTFTDIYILDLHGNSNKKEHSPDGSKDENVFDIQEGVAISIFVKKPGKNGLANVHHAEVWGTRERKYKRLSKENVSHINWKLLTNIGQQSCLGTFYFFTPQAFENIDEYCKGWSIKDIFPVQQNAIKTDRDKLFYDFDREILEARIQTFYSAAGMDPSFRQTYQVENSSSYDLLSRRLKTAFKAENSHECLYRPFNQRWLYYSPGLTSRPAWTVMQHMVAGPNVGLITTRQTSDQWGVFLTTTLAGHKSVSAYDINSLFPLYFYPNPEKIGLFDDDEISGIPKGRRPNLTPAFITAISNKLNLTFIFEGKGDLQQTFGPEDVFNYMYAIFHSLTYRSRYNEFLKIDFPRLPLTSRIELFRKLSGLGDRLVSLHLMEKYGQNVSKYPISGDNLVERIEYAPTVDLPEQGRVWINKTQYFAEMPVQVWKFHIGGYPVCESWLKDRKGRVLSYDDIRHYQRIVAALAETMQLMETIDETIEKHGGWPIE